CFELGTPGIEIDRAPIGTREQHIVEPDAGVPLRINVIGALIDDAESHVFQDRDPLRQWQWPSKAPYLQPNAALVFFQPMMEIDAERALLGEPLDDANVAGRDCRRIGLVEALGESIAITGKQLTDLVRWVGQRQRLVEPVAPGPDDRLDLPLERGLFNLRRRPTGAADDEVDAHQRAFIREKRIEG